jgi:hypothetical protein
MFRDLTFAQAMEDTASFHILLADSLHCQKTLETMTETPEAVVHKTKAIQLINKALSEPMIPAAILQMIGLGVVSTPSILVTPLTYWLLKVPLG